MIFRQLEIGEMQNFCYIIGDDSELAVVDPGWDVEKIKAEGKINKVILTHTHFDHIDALAELGTVTVYVHELEAHNVPAGKNKVISVKEGDIIKVGKVKLKVLHTPGHTEGGICLLVENKLITGDTLFVETIGRTDLRDSNPIDMNDSLRRLSKLPDNTEVWPGHDYGIKKHSTIGYEKEHNPFLK